MILQIYVFIGLLMAMTMLSQLGLGVSDEFSYGLLLVYAMLIALWMIFVLLQTLYLNRHIANRPSLIADLSKLYPDTTFEPRAISMNLPYTFNESYSRFIKNRIK